jgi:hypothetical protein
MMRLRWRVGFPFFAGMMVSMSVACTAQAYTADQQQLCTDDAFRLCSSAIPDVDRVTACMIQRRAQLSPGCAQFFRDTAPQPAVEPVKARKPLGITPRKAKQTRKRS